MPTAARGLTVERLGWDSAHFGLPVGRIVARGDDGDALADALARAADDGLGLVYASFPPDLAIPDELLRRFDGLKVDDRVVFSAAPDAIGEGRSDVIVVDRPAGPPTPALVELAVAAGAFSRFAVDPRIPREAFRRLYAIWIERSCRHETADAVFVAEGGDAAGEPLGLATVAVRGETATIGLVAVSERARRRGVGRATMARFHDWLRDRGVTRVDVATQLANGPACGLYRACGYRPSSFETIYHFRPRG